MRPSINIPRKQVIDLNGFFGLHPSLAAVQAAVGPGASRHRSCRRLARHYALALRRAGLHGIRHARRQEHDRRLAQPHACSREASAADAPFRAVALGTVAAAHSVRQSAGGRGQQRQRLRHRGRQSRSSAAGQYVRGDVRAVGRRRAPRHRARNIRGGQDAEVRRPAALHARRRARTIPRAVSATRCARRRSSSRPISACRSHSPTSAAGTIT